MTSRRNFNTSYSKAGGEPTGIFRAEVVEATASSLKVRIPRLGSQGIYSDVPYYGVKPAVGETIIVGLLEGSSGNPVAITPSPYGETAGGGGSSVGGANTQVQYNNSGVLSGSSNMTFDGTSLDVAGLKLASTAVTSTAAELNILDGVTSTTAELNILDGVVATNAELNTVAGITLGTVTANKAVTVDANKDIASLRNVTLTGTLTVDSVGVTAVQKSDEAFADNDTSLMTSAAVQDKILSYGYTTNTGDITGVTAGTNLSGGGSSGSVTLNLDDPFSVNHAYIKHLQSTDGTLYLGNSSGWELRLTSSSLTPYVNAGLALGDSTYYFAGLYSSTWLRTSGNTGWYSQTHGGGWYMTDSTWVRAYNGKSILTTGDIYLGAMQTFTGSGYATARRQDSSGILKEFVSSERFKTDLADLPLSEAEKVLNCRPILFRDKEEQAADASSPIYAGLSAESLQTAGYEYPLKYDVDEDGGQTTTPRGIHYEHLVAPLITIIKDMRTRLEALES